MPVNTARHGSVLEVTLSNPPVNALGLSVRNALLATIAEAEAAEDIHAVVILGEGVLFSAGADIAEFDAPPASPLLPEVIAAVEACTKPVIAAIEGQALGGGLELALACHYRIASEQARLGLPEVQLGLLPGAGGTQRLPRLVGVKEALAMIVSGKPMAAAKAHAIGLVDELAAPGEVTAKAIAFAALCPQPRRTSEFKLDADPQLFEMFAAENQRAIAGLDAPQACIEAVRAATELPFSEGLAKEHALFLSLMDGRQSRGLRHAFFAERQAARVEGLDRETALRPVNKVGVLGAGTMGVGIAMCFLSANIPVVLLDRSDDALARGTSDIRQTYESSAAKGRIASEDVERLMGLLTTTLAIADMGECDLLIEAVFEDMAVKIETLRQMDDVAKPGAILASNTSFLNLDQLAAATSRAQDVIGLHFFSPAHIMRLLEVVRGAQTAADVLATAMKLARRIGKVGVVAGVCEGFIGNRILLARQRQAEQLLLEGASPQQVDAVHLAIGMPMGPYQMTDLAGMDIGWHRNPNRIDNIRDAFCAAERFGQKSQAGYYDYGEKRKPQPSPAADAIIAEFRASSGATARAISDEEIRARTLYTMINEAAKVLEDGIAQRASDIDVVWLYGYGWPRMTGGLVHWANEQGLAAVVAGLEQYVSVDTVSPLLRACAEEGRPLERL